MQIRKYAHAHTYSYTHTHTHIHTHTHTHIHIQLGAICYFFIRKFFSDIIKDRDRDILLTYLYHLFFPFKVFSDRKW